MSDYEPSGRNVRLKNVSGTRQHVKDHGYDYMIDAGETFNASVGVAKGLLRGDKWEIWQPGEIEARRGMHPGGHPWALADLGQGPPPELDAPKMSEKARSKPAPAGSAKG